MKLDRVRTSDRIYKIIEWTKFDTEERLLGLLKSKNFLNLFFQNNFKLSVILNYDYYFKYN